MNAAAGATRLGAKRAPLGQLNAPSPFLPTQQQQPLQVLLRVRVVKPNTHNTLKSLQMNLAGLLLNAKSDGGDELLNLTVDTVQCALLTTTRQRQLSLGVLSVQLDNQLLATRHPVVLSPASLAEVSGLDHASCHRDAMYVTTCVTCNLAWLWYVFSWNLRAAKQPLGNNIVYC